MTDGASSGDACPLCGAPVDPGASRCPSCGMALAGHHGRPGPFPPRVWWYWGGALAALYVAILVVLALTR